MDFGPHFRFEQDWYFLASFIITLTTASAAIPNLVLVLSYSWKHMVASISTVKLLWWSVLVELCIRNRVTDHCSACFWQIWIPVRRIGSIWATYLPVSFLLSLSLPVTAEDTHPKPHNDNEESMSTTLWSLKANVGLWFTNWMHSQLYTAVIEMCFLLALCISANWRGLWLIACVLLSVKNTSGETCPGF